MKALLIEWDGATGRRAGNIDMSDPKLQCYGWQNLVARPCLELRVIEDDRDVSPYKGIEGVTILEGDVSIDAAIDEHFPSMITIDNEKMFELHLAQRNIDLDKVAGETTEEALKNLKGMGIKGIRENKRAKLFDVYGPKEKRKSKGYPE